MLVGYTSLGSFGAKFRSLVGERRRRSATLWPVGVSRIFPAATFFMRGLPERAILKKPADWS